MAKRRRSNPLLRQANLEASVRYGPEEAALRALAKEASGAFRATVRGEAGAARGIIAAAEAAKPKLRTIYSRAAGDSNAATAALKADLEKLGDAANPYRATTLREAAGAKRRLTEAGARALEEIEDRKVQATQGAAFATKNAVATYRGERAQIKERRSSLAREKGAFKAATVGTLTEAQRKRALEDRKSRRQSRDRRAALQETRRANRARETAAERRLRLDRQKEQRMATEQKSGGSGGKKKSKFTPAVKRSAVEKFEKGVTLARQAKIRKGEGATGVAFLETKGIPSLIGKAATERVVYGATFSDTAAALRRRYGITVKSRRRPAPPRNPTRGRGKGGPRGTGML